MLKPEQIPYDVVRAAYSAWAGGGGNNVLSAMENAIAAAINAWPGFEYRADAAFPAFGYGPAAIILPLPHEASE